MPQVIDWVQTLTILTDARKLLSRTGAWTQGAYARDAAGVGLRASEPTACSWCIQGAMFKVRNLTGNLATPEILRAQEALLRHTNESDTAGLWCWNDQPGRTQEEVLDLFDKALLSVEDTFFSRPLAEESSQ